MNKEPSMLIIEDDVEMANMLRVTMSRYFEVEKVCTSKSQAIQEAKQWLKNNPNPDCLLIDLIINGTGGIDLYQWLRKRGISSKVVFLTGCHPESPEYQEALETGEDLYEKDIFSSKQIAEQALKDIAERNGEEDSTSKVV